MKGFKVVVLVAAVLVAAPLFAAVDAFLKIDGIQGEATDAAHKDWIEIYSFSWGVSNLQTSAAHATGGGAGHQQIQEATFVAGGKAVPKMFLLCQTGKLLPAVFIDIHGQRDTLERVMFASCQNNLMGDGSVRGTFTVKFERATRAGGVQAASVMNPNSTSATNGQLSFGNDPAESLNLLGVRSQGAHSLIIVVRGASSRLMLACASGKHYPSATITCRKAGRDQQEYMKITLQDVLVSSNQRNPDGTTSIGLRFGGLQGNLTGLENLQ